MNQTSAPVILLADDPIEGDCVCKLQNATGHSPWVAFEDIGHEFESWFRERMERFPVGTKFALVASEAEAPF